LDAALSSCIAALLTAKYLCKQDFRNDRSHHNLMFDTYFFGT